MKKNFYRVIGYCFLAIPTIILLLFFFGEVFGGDITGFIHLVQLIPIIIIIFVLWKWPKAGGIILIILGISFAVLYAVSMFSNQNPVGFITTEALLFVPLILAGISFYKYSR